MKLNAGLQILFCYMRLKALSLLIGAGLAVISCSHKEQPQSRLTADLTPSVWESSVAHQEFIRNDQRKANHYSLYTERKFVSPFESSESPAARDLRKRVVANSYLTKNPDLAHSDSRAPWLRK